MAKRDPLYLDADGTTNLPTYNGLELRGAMNAFQPGVIGAGDFKVTAGSGLTVDSAAGRAVVLPTAGAVVFPGLYYAVDDATENSATFERTGGGTGIPANASTNPRLDAVVVHVFDHSLDGSGRRAWVREYVPGVAASGAALGGTLPTLPSNSLLIAEVLVPGSNPTTIPSANIRDRRPWAKGYYRAVTRNQNASGGADYTSTAGSPTAIDATNLTQRVECSGSPIRMTLKASVHTSGASGSIDIFAGIDGITLAGEGRRFDTYSTAGANASLQLSWDWQPSAGSHLIGPYWSVLAGGTATLLAQATYPVEMVIEEIPRPVSNNN
jgi:hypothetical protein